MHRLKTAEKLKQYLEEESIPPSSLNKGGFFILHESDQQKQYGCHPCSFLFAGNSLGSFTTKLTFVKFAGGGTGRPCTSHMERKGGRKSNKVIAAWSLATMAKQYHAPLVTRTHPLTDIPYATQWTKSMDRNPRQERKTSEAHLKRVRSSGRASVLFPGTARDPSICPFQRVVAAPVQRSTSSQTHALGEQEKPPPRNARSELANT